MKNRLLYGFSIFAILTVSCGKAVKGRNGISYKSAVEYNDYIVTRQAALIKNVIDFSNTAQINLDSGEAKLVRFGTQIEGMISELQGMPAFKGDSALRDAAVNSFGFYKRVFEKDYMKIIHLKKQESQTEKDKTEINAILAKVAREEEGYDSSFHEAQLHYAEKNNMKLTENKKGQKEFEKLKKN